MVGQEEEMYSTYDSNEVYNLVFIAKRLPVSFNNWFNGLSITAVTAQAGRDKFLFHLKLWPVIYWEEMNEAPSSFLHRLSPMGVLCIYLVSGTLALLKRKTAFCALSYIYSVPPQLRVFSLWFSVRSQQAFHYLHSLHCWHFLSFLSPLSLFPFQYFGNWCADPVTVKDRVILFPFLSRIGHVSLS